MVRENAGHERKIAWELLKILYKREASVDSQPYKYSRTKNNQTLPSSMTTTDSLLAYCKDIIKKTKKVSLLTYIEIDWFLTEK